jgi:hypothetical protein
MEDADWGAGVGFKIALFGQPNLAMEIPICRTEKSE